MTTLKEIAVRCGCSVATVSKALNGMPDIGAETTQRIQQIAREMGYVPNAAARTLKTHRSHTIGMMLFLHEENVWLHDHFARVAAGIHQELEAAGYDATPVTCTSERMMGRYLEYCRHRGYDGVVVMSGAFQEKGLQELINSSIPLVVIDHAFPHRSAILMDHARGMADLVEHVYRKGHRRIAYIYGSFDEENSVGEIRLNAFQSVTRQLGLSIPPEYIKPAAYRDLASSARATCEFMALPVPPTCILYPDDQAYVGGMHALMDMGLRIPQDISVAGYDGIPLSRFLRPRLTTVVQDGEAAGRAAGRELLNAIRASRSFTPQHIVLPCTLLEGETVAEI